MELFGLALLIVLQAIHAYRDHLKFKVHQAEIELLKSHHKRTQGE